MLDGLAFLTESEVPAGMEYLRGVPTAPNGVTQLWVYFDATKSTTQLSASSGDRCHPVPSGCDASYQRHRRRSGMCMKRR